jgi:hypothetical protein
MVNPEKLATLGTYDTVHRQTKHKETAQKNKKISNTDPTIKKTGINSYLQGVSDSVSYKAPAMLLI